MHSKTLKLHSARTGGAFSWAMVATALFLMTSSLCAQATDLRTPDAPATPHLNGPKIYGVRPGHPFLYRIPCTGDRPVLYSAQHLPGWLNLDQQNGIISGIAPAAAGRYSIRLKAANALGKNARSFTVVVGPQIGLTPQMGWNDWYTYYGRITDQDVRAAAAAMVSSGMADYGYQFVDIDDTWSRKPGSNDPESGGAVRDANGNILCNARFPDMSALTAYIHSLGLKAGIYSSPGPLTCARFEGSYQHEEADARQFAKWGFDLLKYDWCSYGGVAKGKSLEDMQEPYKKMGQILGGLDRDVVLNMCQYGMGEVWKWGQQVGGNSWRTTGDLGAVRNAALPGFYKIGLANAKLSMYAGRGGWNDPDYILIGTVGNALAANAPPHPTGLSHDEQYSYMSMWSLMAAPLFFSGDMTNLDKFTLNVLCNSEVIDIDQDSLGKQAAIVKENDDELVLKKMLDDGSVAVGLFNLSNQPRSISTSWNDLGLKGRKKVRDVWKHQDLGSAKGRISMTVPTHGVMMVRLIPGRFF